MHFVTFLLYYGGGFGTFLFLMLFGEQVRLRQSTVPRTNIAYDVSSILVVQTHP